MICCAKAQQGMAKLGRCIGMGICIGIGIGMGIGIYIGIGIVMGMGIDNDMGGGMGIGICLGMDMSSFSVFSLPLFFSFSLSPLSLSLYPPFSSLREEETMAPLPS